MSARQDYPSSEPSTDLPRYLGQLRNEADAAAKAIARGALPEPLFVRAVTVAPGPPPTFRVEIVNPLTGGVIVLGTI